MRLVVADGTGLIALAFVPACGPLDRNAPSQGGSVTRSLADPNSAMQVAAGALVWQARGASCRGRVFEGRPGRRILLPDGSYPAPPHDGSGRTRRHGDRQRFDATAWVVRRECEGPCSHPMTGEATRDCGQLDHRKLAVWGEMSHCGGES